RRIDVTRRATGRALLAEHVPGLDRLPHLDLEPVDRDAPDERETELVLWREPAEVEGKARVLQVADHVLEVLLHEVRQHEAIVERGPPAHHGALVRLAPE